MIVLSKQQKEDAAECEKMAEQGKNKECFGCSCSVCIMDCRVNKLAQAAPELLEALKRAYTFITNGVELGYIQMPEPESLDPTLDTPDIIYKAIAKAEGWLE